MATKLDKTIVSNDNVSNEGQMMAGKRKGGVIMTRINMALTGIALCALFAITGCTKPGGNNQGDVGLFPLNTEQACANVTADDTQLKALCDDPTSAGLKATLIPPFKDSNGDGNDDSVPMTSELASTDVDGGTADAFSFADVTPNIVYGFSVDDKGLPSRCHMESDGMDHLASTVLFKDKESLDPQPLDLVCSPKQEETDGGINDGGINMSDICPYVGPTIKGKAFDGSQPITATSTPLAGVTFLLSGPIEQLQAALGDDFSPTCTTTAEKPSCGWDCLIPNNYYSITVTADGFEGAIDDFNGVLLVAGGIYNVDIPLQPSVDNPADSLVPFPGFNMDVGDSIAAADIYFGHYDASEAQVSIPASEATYAVAPDGGTSVTITGADGGVDAVLNAVEVGQTHIERCWTGVEPNPCQTFVVTVF